MKNQILVSGASGFIGFHLSKILCEGGYSVVGFDNINDYYDVNLKYARLKELGIEQTQIEYGKEIVSTKFPNFIFIKLDLTDRESISNLFTKYCFDFVCHLAAQAGVRYSLENPHTYAESNLVGFLNILEACRRNKIKHLVYASSSSVYGLNEKMPLSESANVDHPISLYAATKKANELMAHSYSHLYRLPTTGLRFFTVYGPWGRPDMSPILFASAIKTGKPIKVFNNGKMIRDFTYIDDIVDGIMKVLFTPSKGDESWDTMDPNPSNSKAPYKIYNIGNSKPIELLHFIEELEKSLGKSTKKEFLPVQPGDVLKTFADITRMQIGLKYHPTMNLRKGVSKFTKWYLDYYHNSIK